MWDGNSNNDDSKQGMDSERHNFLSESPGPVQGLSLANHIDRCNKNETHFHSYKPASFSTRLVSRLVFRCAFFKESTGHIWTISLVNVQSTNTSNKHINAHKALNHNNSVIKRVTKYACNNTMSVWGRNWSEFVCEWSCNWECKRFTMRMLQKWIQCQCWMIW